MKDLTDLKNKLYEILLCASNGGDDRDIKINQQLGVSITKAAQRDGGISIIQLQSAHIHNITETVVEALKVVDVLEFTILKEPVLIDVPAIEHKPVESEPIEIEVKQDPMEGLCEHLYRKRVGWKEMQSFVKEKYLKFVLERQPTRNDAAKFLGVQKTYLSKMSGGKSDDKRTGA